MLKNGQTYVCLAIFQHYEIKGLTTQFFAIYLRYLLMILNHRRAQCFFWQIFWNNLNHLVSRFACNTRVIVDTSSNAPVCRDKLVEQILEFDYQVDRN